MTTNTNTTSGAADRAIENCPELNIGNYDEVDVEHLNDWAIRANDEIDRLHALAAGQATAAQQGVAYAALPTSSHAGSFLIGTCPLYTADQLRDFADATHALRAARGQAPTDAKALAEADRRAGEAERLLATCKEDVMRFEQVRSRMKYQWGAEQRVSFDEVWDEALALKKAAQAAECVTAPAGVVGPDGMMRDELRSMIEGMSVSVDVSTGDHDAGHRYFGTVTEVMECQGNKHGVTLLVQDAEPNFTATPTSGAADLRTAAQAVVDRWDTPLWKDVPATAEYIGRLRAALAAGQATAPQQGAQEPVAWLNPWRADQVTTDYDAYGERGIPLYTAPQPAPAPLSEVPYEKRKAIQEGEQISASDAWFKARHEMLDTVDRRNVFRAGFDRGWSAALAAQGGKCPMRIEP